MSSSSRRFAVIALAVCALFLFSGLLTSSDTTTVFDQKKAEGPTVIGPGNNYGGKPVADRDIDVAQLSFETWPSPVTETINDVAPTRDFVALKDEVPVHQEQLQIDGFAYGALFCSRTANYQTDPYYAAIQQQVWRILWSEFASIHPIVVFVCPYVREEIRDALRGQGALVEEVALVNVPGDHPLKDHFAFLNIFGATKYKRIAMFDSEAFPISNIDDVFVATLEQKCRFDKLNMQDEMLFYTQSEEANDYALAGLRIVTKSNNYTDMGLLVLSPNVAQQKRLLRNVALLTQKDVSLSSFLNSPLAFSGAGPFPIQSIDRVYNVGQHSLGDVETGTLDHNAVKVLHDKLWRPKSLITGRKNMQQWQTLWKRDWATMCERYNEAFFVKWRQLGRLPGFEELVDGVQELAKEMNAEKAST